MNAIKGTFCVIAIAIARGKATFSPESLIHRCYDLSQDYPDNLGYLLDVLLVAESEWSSKDYVKDDFQKLLLARSKYRIMIYQCETDGTVIRWAKEQIRNFKLTQQGDRYLFCSWQFTNKPIGQFHYELFIAP